MIGDTDFNVSKLYGMLPAAVSGDPLRAHGRPNQTGAQRVRDRAG